MSFGMIERVARALAEDNGGMEWQLYMPDAEVAIRAMREPTEEMIAHAAETPGMSAASAAMQIHQMRGYGFASGSFDAGSPLHQAWSAMIDAALSPNYTPDPA